MTLVLTIGRADETVDLVRRAIDAGTPYDAVISLEHPGAKDYTEHAAFRGRAPRLAEDIGAEWHGRQLILVCWDVEHENFGVPVPPRDIVADAIAFVKEQQPASRPMRLLVHCRSGKARSTALGVVLLLHEDIGAVASIPDALDELVRVRSICAPNIVIVQHGDDLLGLKGALVAAVEADAGLTERRAESERRRIHQVESQRARQAPAP